MKRKPHSHRLRVGRHSEPGGCYLVTACCDGREPHFAGSQAARIVMEALRWLDGNGRMELLAAVVMPDHIHFIMGLRGRTIEKLVHTLKSYSAQQIIRECRRRGRVWQPGYHDRALRDDRGVADAIGYCLHNPVRAGLAEDFRDYPHLWCKAGLD